MEKLVNKINQLEEKKRNLMVKQKKTEMEIKDIDTKIEEIKKEKMAFEYKNVTHVLDQKGINLNELLKAIQRGDLSVIKNKVEESIELNGEN